jgi:hypothetical protein
LINLCLIKPIWVDECYTFYGVNHDSYTLFFDSILSGINFSPPLYFLFNFCLQLVFNTSIEVLRIESLIWTLIGLVICFVVCRRMWGTYSAIIGSFLVACSSDLLLTNATEARHYSMFFACAAWVLYAHTREKTIEKLQLFTLFSHLFLCLVHYFGIIFSSIIGLVLLIRDRKIPTTLICCWLIAIPLYLFFLTNQSSHLGNWPRPNSINDLLDVYRGTIVFLFLLIPVFSHLLCVSNKHFSKQPLGQLPHTVVTVAFIWYLIPLLVWCISHISDVNLFKERYFIPKEAALVLLVSFACHKAFELFGLFTGKSFAGKYIPLWSTTILCLALIVLHFNRSLFALDPARNYYTWLIYDYKYSSEDHPIVFCGDPSFFPNTYQQAEKAYFLVDDEKLNLIYKKFSSKIKVLNYKQLNDFKSFILVSGKEDLKKIDPLSFELTSLGKFHYKLPLICTKVERKP